MAVNFMLKSYSFPPPTSKITGSKTYFCSCFLLLCHCPIKRYCIAVYAFNLMKTADTCLTYHSANEQNKCENFGWNIFEYGDDAAHKDIKQSFLP